LTFDVLITGSAWTNFDKQYLVELLQKITMSGEVKKKGKFGPKGKGKKDNEQNGGSLEIMQGKKLPVWYK
jgi:hypothetical protein